MAWGSSIETVYSCPIARRTTGIVVIPPHILRALAGAVKNQWEWLSFFLGRVLNDGKIVIVEEMYTPPEQKRTGGTCSIDGEHIPEAVSRRIVGVVHSHNNMTARFSGVDLGPGGLNQTYPMSIVIGSSLNHLKPGDPDHDEALMLGYAYQGVIRHKGPCGAYLKSPLRIVPMGYADWPMGTEVSEPKVNQLNWFDIEVEDLGDCQRYTEGDKSSVYGLQREANCGCVEDKIHIRRSIFGADGFEILSQLPPPNYPVVKTYSSSAEGEKKLTKKERKALRRLSQGGQPMKLLPDTQVQTALVVVDEEADSSKDTQEIPLVRVTD